MTVPFPQPKNPAWRLRPLRQMLVCSWRGHRPGLIPAVIANPYAIKSSMWGCERCGEPLRPDVAA